ncbi:MAG: rRNA maturation RNase YbeY [candidate division WOR-3 bacterium]
MRIEVFGTRSAGLGAAVRRLGCRVDRELGLKGWRVNVVFTDNRTITRLNRRFLGRNRPTDVLAFPAIGLPGAARREAVAGEVYVSRTQARIQAAEWRVSLRSELLRLVLHGLLHLAGLEHREMADYESRFLKGL